jgi:hypothetical protein
MRVKSTDRIAKMLDIESPIRKAVALDAMELNMNSPFGRCKESTPAVDYSVFNKEDLYKSKLDHMKSMQERLYENSSSHRAFRNATASALEPSKL